jgi:hypothetical protein
VELQGKIVTDGFELLFHVPVHTGEVIKRKTLQPILEQAEFHIGEFRELL